jgi:hypothetical protein
MGLKGKLRDVFVDDEEAFDEAKADLKQTLGRGGDESLDYTPAGSFVTPKRLKGLRPHLRDGERVQYLTQGSWASSTTGGKVKGGSDFATMGVTEERVLIVVSQLVGEHMYSIEVSDIDGVVLHTYPGNVQYDISTPGQNYSVNAVRPTVVSGAEYHVETADYIRSLSADGGTET